MTPDKLKRLTYSKYLFRRAKYFQQLGNELSSAEAVLAAHDAAEMLMRVITDHLGASPADKIMDFWKLVKDKTGSEPPHKGAMDRLNNLRVGFKHKGNLPNSSVVADLMPSVAAFCAESAEQYLGVDYESVSLIDLIPNAEARDKVKEAEKAKAESNIPNALLALGIAFDKLHDEARKRDSLGLIPQFHGRSDVDQAHIRAVRQVIDTVNIMILGIHPPRLRRFSASTPIRTYAMSGAMQVSWPYDPGRLGSDDYDFCHQFVIDFALRLAGSG
ncbi:MAG: hypothetical protein P4N24_21735 [Acidobacteriota bacterium]|nr:hypothetical protein [Acidobacteriota bacterium]